MLLWILIVLISCRFSEAINALHLPDDINKMQNCEIKKLALLVYLVILDPGRSMRSLCCWYLKLGPSIMNAVSTEHSNRSPMIFAQLWYSLREGDVEWSPPCKSLPLSSNDFTNCLFFRNSLLLCTMRGTVTGRRWRKSRLAVSVSVNSVSPH